mmetsp:Transcript_24492/g.61599  ORF Transcript_24492/g.61599 Transcript_24492/m.61599 type:complete len:358 (+) Transcript_24492:1323-2396(+)
MSQRDRTAIRIYPVRWQSEFFGHRQALAREGFVRFYHVQVPHRPLRFLQALLRCRDRSQPHHLWVQSCARERFDTGQNRQLPLRSFPPAAQDHERRAVVQPARVSRRDGPVLLQERRLQLREPLHLPALRVHVLVLGQFADRHQVLLVVRDVRQGLLLGVRGELVLLLTGQLVLLRDVLRRDAHVVLVEGARQPVREHGVRELHVAHLLPEAGGFAGEKMGRVGHGLLPAASDQILSLPRLDRHHAQLNHLETRPADLVDGVAWCCFWQPGHDACLPCRVLPAPRREHLAHDHFVDGGRWIPDILETLFQHHRAHLWRGKLPQTPIELPDGTAAGSHNHHVVVPCCLGARHPSSFFS